MHDGAGGHFSTQATPIWQELESQRPCCSARRVVTWVQLIALALTIAAIGWAFATRPTHAWLGLHIAGGALFAAAVGWRLFATASFLGAAPPPRASAPEALPGYTILCPLYREANVVRALAQSLARLDYPRHALDIKFVIEDDDCETRAAIEAIEFLRPFEIVNVGPDGPRTKPKALNIALAVARGEFVTVYDAEDRPHPQQLRAAVAAFTAGDARLACVQAPLLIDNARASWIASQFAVEYAIQFLQIVPLLARLGLPVPLGGTSNHFRLAALRAVGAWDAYNVTEDADLGYRLARKGWRVGAITPPTWEEAPTSYRAWRRQRARWIKGHLQTWLVLMRHPLRTARELGLAGFAAMQIILGGGVLAAFAHAPLALALLIAALINLRTIAPVDFALAVFGYVTAIHGGLAGALAARDKRLILAVLTMPLYWPLSLAPALRALAELLMRPHHWAKTTHGVSARPHEPFSRRSARVRQPEAGSVGTHQ